MQLIPCKLHSKALYDYLVGAKRLFENLKRKRFAMLTDEHNTSRKLTTRKDREELG